MELFLSIYAAIISTVNLLVIAMLYQKTFPRVYISGERIKPEDIKPGGVVQVKQSSARGAIYTPPSDTETVREQIIEQNRAQGKDTPISEVREYEEDTSQTA